MTRPQPARRLGPRTKKSLLLLAPALVCICVISLFPILRGIYVGFTDYRVGMPIRFNGLANYVSIYRNGYLKIAMTNTVFIVAVALAATYLLSLCLALLLNSHIPLRRFWRLMLIVPWAVPPVAKVGVWKRIFSSTGGQLNYILQSLGVTSGSIGWLSDDRYAIYAVITIIVWGCIPFTTMSFLAALQAIPGENYEAADMDGAGPLHKLWYITLPGLRGISMVTVSLLFMWITGDFSSQFLLTGGGPGSATLTVAVESYRQGFRSGNFGLATAYGNIMILFCTLFLVLYLRALRQKEG